MNGFWKWVSGVYLVLVSRLPSTLIEVVLVLWVTLGKDLSFTVSIYLLYMLTEGNNNCEFLVTILVTL